MRTGEQDSSFADSPQMRMAAQVVVLLSLLIAGLQLLYDVRSLGSWVVIATAAGIVAAIVLILIVLSKRRSSASPLFDKLDFEPHARSLYAYSSQLDELLGIVTELGELRKAKPTGLSPLVALFGPSGVGKSQFLLCAQKRLQGRTLHVDLRRSVADMRDQLAKFIDDNDHDTAARDNSQNAMGLVEERISSWLANRTALESVRSRLANVTLFIDQFEQVMTNELAREQARSLVENVTPYCLTTVVAVRSDVLAPAIQVVRDLLRTAGALFRCVRMFVISPVSEDSDLVRELTVGIWHDVMGPDNECSKDLREQLIISLKDNFADKAFLPVTIRLAVYAMKHGTATTLARFNDEAQGDIRILIDRLTADALVSSGDKNSAVRILFALTDEAGVALQLEPTHLRYICGLRLRRRPSVDDILKVLGNKDGNGIIRQRRGSTFTIAHEYIADIAQTQAAELLTQDEREQIRMRQRLLTKHHRGQAFQETMEKHACLDPVMNATVGSMEGVFGLLSIALVLWRLFVWRPFEFVLGMDVEFAPAALASVGAAFYYWLLYGNIGRPLRRLQTAGGLCMWWLIRALPIVGAAACCVWPRHWLLVGAVISAVTAVNQYFVGRWAKRSASAHVAYLFCRYSLTTASVVAIMCISHFMLANASTSGAGPTLELIASILCSIGLMRYGVTWWSGRNVRSILARLECDMLLREGKAELR